MRPTAGGVVAIHLAVLADTAPSGDQQVCGVLAYDGYGRRHLHPLASTTATAGLHDLLHPGGPCQLQLPLVGEAPAATSGGRTWRTWVLATIPTSLRALPPERLAAAFADQLVTERVA